MCCSDQDSCGSNCGSKRKLHRGEGFVYHISMSSAGQHQSKISLNLCNTSGVQLLFTDAGHAEIEDNVPLSNSDVDHCSCIEVDEKGAYVAAFSIRPGCYTGSLVCRPTGKLAGRLIQVLAVIFATNLYRTCRMRPYAVLL